MFLVSLFRLSGPATDCEEAAEESHLDPCKVLGVNMYIWNHQMNLMWSHMYTSVCMFGYVLESQAQSKETQQKCTQKKKAVSKS